ncbi:MAG: ATP synthase F1 subunit gamma [Solirubrobacterales bacterium]
MATQQDIKNRISSVKNIRKITRAMEMVAAARLRKAEERIEEMRPYAQAIRKMTQQTADAAGVGAGSRVPLLQKREQVKRVGVLVVTGDRGLAGSFNSQIVRAGIDQKREIESEGAKAVFYAVGKRGNSSLSFRNQQVAEAFTGFTDKPSFADAREIGDALTSAYMDEELDRVELIYNRYVSPLTQYVRRHRLLPLQEAEVFGEGVPDEKVEGDDDLIEAHNRAEWVYEPEPEQALQMLFSEYVDLSVYRALLESTASEHGSRMTAMRSASENAEEMIEDLSLEANRARQDEITQEILEVVSGAEALSG